MSELDQSPNLIIIEEILNSVIALKSSKEGTFESQIDSKYAEVL
jgi:hypothetical protein